MNPDMALDICRRAMEAALWVMAPVLLSALCAGVLAGLFQAATQLQEPTLAFVPKLLALCAAITIFGPWMSDHLRSFTTDLYNLMGGLQR